jgi:hypothetical protein
MAYAVSAGRKDVDEAMSLEGRLAAVERRTQVIEDIQAIEDVMSAW